METRTAWLIGGPAAGSVYAVKGSLVQVAAVGDTPIPPQVEPTMLVPVEKHAYEARKLVIPGHEHPITVYAHESLKSDMSVLRAVGMQLVADARMQEQREEIH